MLEFDRLHPSRRLYLLCHHRQICFRLPILVRCFRGPVWDPNRGHGPIFHPENRGVRKPLRGPISRHRPTFGFIFSTRSPQSPRIMGEL